LEVKNLKKNSPSKRVFFRPVTGQVARGLGSASHPLGARPSVWWGSPGCAKDDHRALHPARHEPTAGESVVPQNGELVNILAVHNGDEACAADADHFPETLSLR
jgi:hypothetical protein